MCLVVGFDSGRIYFLIRTRKYLTIEFLLNAHSVNALLRKGLPPPPLPPLYFGFFVEWNKQYFWPFKADTLQRFPFANIFLHLGIYSPHCNTGDMLGNTHEFHPCCKYHICQKILRVPQMRHDCRKFCRLASYNFFFHILSPSTNTSSIRIAPLLPDGFTRTKPQGAWKPGTLTTSGSPAVLSVIATSCSSRSPAPGTRFMS